MPATATVSSSPVLYDQSAKRAIQLDYPGLTAQDVLDFCEYFKVGFYSLTTFTTPPAGMGKHDLFRVATSDYPTRGLDLTFRSVVSWVRNRSKAYTDPQAGDEVELKDHGQVRVVCVAQALNSSDGGPLVVFTTGDGAPQYLALERFTGMGYDRQADTYYPNAVLLTK